MPRSVELFLGGLSKDTRRADLEDIFSKYGRITRCDIKYVNGYAGTAYGFVGYEDDRDAEDAIKNENGRKICGQSVVIERSKSKAWNKSSKVTRRDDRYGYRRSYRSISRSRSRSRNRRRRHRSRTRSRSRSRSPRRNTRSRRDRSRSRSKSRSRTRSRSLRSSRSPRQEKNESSKRSRSRSASEEKSKSQKGDSTPVKNQTDNKKKNLENDLHEDNSANGISINEITSIVEQTIKNVDKQESSKEELDTSDKKDHTEKSVDHNNNNDESNSNKTDA